MGKVEQGIEEWQHAVSQHEDTARRGNGGIAEHGWVLRLRRGRGGEGERKRGEGGIEVRERWKARASHGLANAVVVAGEGVEGP